MSYARAPPPALAATSATAPIPDSTVDQQRQGWPAQGPSTSPVSAHPSPIDAPELARPPATMHHAALQKFPQHHQQHQQQQQQQQQQQHAFPHQHHYQQVQQQQHPQRQLQHVHPNPLPQHQTQHQTQQQSQQQAHHQQYYSEPEQAHYAYLQHPRDGPHQGNNGRIGSGGRALAQGAINAAATHSAQPMPMPANPLAGGSDSTLQRVPQQHLAQQLPSSQSHGQAPDTTAANGEHTYAVLQESILGHVFFPLVLKKVYEVFADKPMPAPNTDPHFTDLEHRALGLKSYAELYGLDGACERWASTDVFMAAMVSALSGLRDIVVSGPVNPLLAETLSTAGAAVKNSAAQPRAPGVAPTLAPHQDAPEQLLAPLMPSGDRSDLGLAGGRITRSRFLGPVQPPPRRKLKPVARRCLEDWFQTHIDSPYPSEGEKQGLADYCQLDIQQVCIHHIYMCGVVVNICPSYSFSLQAQMANVLYF
jgi:hypothetical protein